MKVSFVINCDLNLRNHKVIHKFVDLGYLPTTQTYQCIHRSQMVHFSPY